MIDMFAIYVFISRFLDEIWEKMDKTDKYSLFHKLSSHFLRLNQAVQQMLGQLLFVLHNKRFDLFDPHS